MFSDERSGAFDPSEALYEPLANDARIIDRDAWNKRKGLSPPDAERMYVEALIRVSFATFRSFHPESFSRAYAQSLFRSFEGTLIERKRSSS
jgi:hypothetical protein